MTVPVPSQVRVVRVYTVDQQLSARGGNVATLLWSTKHPLDIEWWWVDATGWCQDIGDVIGSFTTDNAVFTGGDGLMSILATAKSVDNLQAGIRFLGGTPGSTYTITVTLNGSRGADIKVFDISIQCNGDLPLGLSTPWLADFSSPNNSSAYYYL